MSVAAIVQARTSSTRLPGKVLRHAAGKPLLAYVVERLQHANSVDRVVVATSDERSDDAIASLCRASGVHCHRGPSADVAGRILGAMHAVGADIAVRISGDSPLLDQRLIDDAVALLEECKSDLATNVYPTRTFPRGQSVEAFRAQALERGYALAADASDLEHVTPVFYRHSAQFRIASFTRKPGLGDLRLVVDTQEDFDRFTRVVSAMDRPHWQYGLDDVLELHRTCAV
jgi:spore coat polysaccharide biosynthesis protein SpsF